MPSPVVIRARTRWALLATAAATTVFAFLPVAPPWQVRLLYAPICHQKAERSLNLFGEVMAVCSRCSGLYFGATLAVLLALLMPRRLWWPHKTWFFAALLPTAVDAMLPWVGLPQLSLVPRHFVAWPAGFAAGWFVALGVAVLASADASFDRSVEVGDG
ncbi:MAG: DUF2085 domain-containing protein [Acidobacteria bacterium]|nr:DUF2085 domain-containing protein [Acidobacteriota bacterium]NIM63757.1 DUF2085 domain-containing protein [Acidobacteriota bacterium]NIO59326.1 DUF2085 domain-containing protein [Acidobacteriota bacterium]NIQ30340.1 DUF2085 domain-containing protein [Acidobacteriota bacterium]NIQ85277.1 DUF2085 domain-containing protein [Acidobacteriota bacterium]